MSDPHAPGADVHSADEAPHLIVDERPTWVRYRVLAFLAVMTFVLYLDRVCLGQAAPLMQTELGLSDTALGFVHAAFTLAYAAFEIPTGRWGDRYGSRGVLTRIVVWWSFFTALTGAATGLWMLLIVRFLFGGGEAGALPNSARILRQWFPESARGEAQGIVTTGMMIGGAAAPVASQFLIDGLGNVWKLDVFGSQWAYAGIGWRWTFVVFGLIGLTWAISFYLWFRDDPAEHPAVNNAERELIASGRRSGKAIWSEFEAPAPDLIKVDEHSTGAHERIPWRQVLPCANIWLLGGAMMTMSGVYYMLFSWYPKYLQSARGVAPDQSSWLTSLVSGWRGSGLLFRRAVDGLAGYHDWKPALGPHGAKRGRSGDRRRRVAGQHLHRVERAGLDLRRDRVLRHSDPGAGMVGQRHAGERTAPGCPFRNDEHARGCRRDLVADFSGPIR